MATILIVDDASSSRAVLARVLRGTGYQTLCAPDGNQALAVLERETVDLVLLDMVMPEMDGMSFLQAVRRMPQFDTLPIIVFTALSDGPSFRQARQLGADKYIIKSRRAGADLLHHIRRLLDRREQEQRVPASLLSCPPLYRLA